MSKPTESQRIADLESIRTQDNGRSIDEAKASGKTAGEVANEILLSRAKFGVDPTVMDTVIESINTNPNRKPRNDNPVHEQNKDQSFSNNETDIDRVAAAANLHRQHK
jgi:hypothetical protein